MPPPPRRRRPVQPATRVRLPRGARPQATPANGSVGVEPDDITANGAATEAAEAEAPEVEAAEYEDEELPADAVRRRIGAAGEREPLLLPVCLGVAAVLLGGLAVWFGLKTGGSPATNGFGPSAANIAVSNAAATTQVSQQIDNAVDTIFSYNYTDTAKTAQAAKTLLTGKASAEYATLFKVVQQEAPAEKLVLTTTVTNSGVEFLNAYSARLLIFANQTDTGSSSKQTTAAGAMFAVTAVHQDGRWKIEDIDTFSSPG
jgi:Mce-associated membrane protein